MYDDNNYRPFGSEYGSNDNEERKAEEPKIQPEVNTKPKKKKGGALKKILFAITLGLLFGLFVGTGIYAVNLFTDKFKPEVSVTEDVPKPVPEISTVNPVKEEPDDDKKPGQVMAVVSDVSSVVEECMPSIVAITSEYTETYQSFFGPQVAQGESSGSGIIVGENDDELFIATNNHVISDSDKLTVQFINEETATAYVKGTDPDVDLAIIAIKLSDIDTDTMGEIKIAKLGDSDALKVGEPAIAIGNALGYGQSVTVGVISAVNRQVNVDNISNTMIQTDAAINPGNSGGALINIKGEVIGINEVKIASTSVEGVGYSIPISAAEPILADLMNRQIRDKVSEEEAGFLGIAGVDVSRDISEMYGMPEGVYVASVEEDTAAERAGFYKGYVITKFDGQKVKSMEELRDLISRYSAGTTVDVTVQVPGQTGYSEQVMSVTLGSKPD